jgi:CubicO group peptidase (beta-lactamase class C family)
MAQSGPTRLARTDISQAALMSDIALAIEEAMLSPRLRHVQSVLVSSGGKIVCEKYFRDRRREDLTNVHSVTKSFVSTLVGIAMQDGWLAPTTTIADVIPEHLPRDEPEKGLITVERLLTMTSGLTATGAHDIDEIADAGESWVEGPLKAPFRTGPKSAAFEYNNGAVHVLSVMLATAAERPLHKLAEERLFAPLGINVYRWPTDPDGNPIGSSHLEVRPLDLLRLGELYLQRGRVGSDLILNPTYIERATTASTRGGPPEETAYGYLWWVTERAGMPAYFAGGFGGQYVTVVPHLELIVVTTGDVDVLIPSSLDPLLLVEDVVIPAVSN